MVQKPSDTQCTLPNSDHVIIQVLMNGADIARHQREERPASARRRRRRHPRGDAREGRRALSPRLRSRKAGYTGEDIWIATCATSASTRKSSRRRTWPRSSRTSHPRVPSASDQHLCAERSGLPGERGTSCIATDAGDARSCLNPTTQPSYLLFHFAEQRF